MTQPKIAGNKEGIPRTIFGSDGTDWYAVQVDSDGHAKIDVVTAALPTDAATQTTLAACLTALQLIDDLRAALGSVNTDDLQVDVKTLVPPVPASPINVYGSTNVTASVWEDIATYTVSAGKKLYIHHFSLGPVATAQLAGFAYMGRLTINDTVYDFLQSASKESKHVSLPTPIVASAGQVVAVEAYHAEVAARWLCATIIGFEA